jgi:hypothetical protein
MGIKVMSFNYSEKQWEKIDACLPEGFRLKGLTPALISDMKRLARQSLTNAANRYLKVKATQEPAKRLAALKSIRRMAKELAIAINGIDPRDKFVVDQLDLPLAALEIRAQCGEFYVTRQLPRMALYREVFNLWTGWSGDLVYKQHDGEPHGPLISFVQAAVGPILRTALSPSTIRTRIDVEKTTRAKEDAEFGNANRYCPDITEEQIFAARFVRRHFAEEIAAIRFEFTMRAVSLFQIPPDDPNRERRVKRFADRQARRVLSQIKALYDRVPVVHVSDARP